MGSEAKQLCVLFADVAGSTRLYELLGDVEALRIVDACMGALREVTEAQGGRVVKTIGDEVMSVFDTAQAGFEAACAMQRRVDEMLPQGGIKLAIRAGFHHGPALEEDADVFGDTVNTAARMAGLAKARQIMTTGETVTGLPEAQQRSTRHVDTLTVKGKAGDIRVFEVIWQAQHEMTMMARSPAELMGAMKQVRLRIRYLDRELTLDNHRPPLVMGRDHACELVILEQRASRQHARIERRRDKFMLVDQSTNGTFLTLEGEPEVVVRREEALLRGRGRIAFGHSASEPGTHVMEFEVLR